LKRCNLKDDNLNDLLTYDLYGEIVSGHFDDEHLNFHTTENNVVEWSDMQHAVPILSVPSFDKLNEFKKPIDLHSGVVFAEIDENWITTFDFCHYKLGQIMPMRITDIKAKTFCAVSVTFQVWEYEFSIMTGKQVGGNLYVFNLPFSEAIKLLK